MISNQQARFCISTKIGDIVRAHKSIAPDVVLREAISAIKKSDHGGVVVVDNKKVVGILTESDIIALLSKKVSLESEAGRYATKNVITVKADRDIMHALSLIIENNIHYLVVVNENDDFVSLVSKREIIRSLDEDVYRSHMRIEHILGPDAKRLITLPLDAMLCDALDLMVQNNIGSVLATRNGLIVGILTKRDILGAVAASSGLEEKVEGFMSTPLVTVDKESLLVDVIQLMNERSIRRVLVTEKSSKEPVGILTEGDIVKNIDYSTLLERKLKHAKDVLNLLPEVVIEVIDAKGEQIIVWANKKAREVFGDKVIDKKANYFVGEKEWMDIYVRLLKNGKVEKFILEKESFVYEISGFLVPKRENTEKNRIKLILRDITHAVRQGEFVKNELETYQQIINSTADMIMLYDSKSGRFAIANHAATRTLGYTKEELMNLSIFDVVVDDEDFLRSKIDEIVRSDRIVKGQRIYKTSRGETLPVEITATKAVLKNNDFILIVARDISEKISMENEITRRNEKLLMYHNFINSVNRALSIDEAYDVLGFYLRQLGIESIHIYKIDPALAKISDSVLKQISPLWEEDCMTSEISRCKVVLSGSSFVVNSSEVYGCPLARFAPLARSYMCMGVFSVGKIVGMVSIASKKEGFFDKDSVRFIEDLINAFSLSLTNLRLIEINRELSVRDPLTNLYNRRFVSEFLEKSMQNCKRRQEGLCVVMIDLDDFKMINDIYGHNAGDMALKHVARVISDTIRASDVAGRYGGEEFIVILPQTEPQQAAKVAERIRGVLEMSKIEIDDCMRQNGDQTGQAPGPKPEVYAKTINLTASFGISYCDGRHDVFADHLVAVADSRMYRAKKEGKNRVIAF